MPDPFANMDPDFADKLNRLIGASNGKLRVASGYRSPERQQQLYSAAIEKYGSESAARHWVAPPGHSNHNKGIAADLSGDLEFAHQMAPQFGLHFPMSYERWHIEPVGSRGAQMATKSKSRGIGPTSVQTSAMPSVQTNQNGGIDLSSVLAALSGRQQAPLDLYRPEDPRTVPNPGYNPPQQDVSGQFPAPGLGDLVGANSWQQGQPQQGAPAAPTDLRQVLQQPSDQQSYEQNAVAAQQGAPNPMAGQAAEHQASAKLQQSIADLIKANPAAQYNIAEYLPYPMRQQLAIPQRQAPQLDPFSGGLAALAGLIDPQAAGQYGTGPLQAGLGHAQQQFDDAQLQYKQHEDQLTKEYEDHLASRNDLAHYLQEKSGANFQNATAKREAALLAGQAGAKATSEGGLADALTGIGQQDQQAGALGLQANLAQQRIQSGLAQNKAKVDYANAGDKRENDLLKALIQGGVHNYGSDQRLTGVRDTNDARQDIATDNNTSREKVGAGHDNAGIKKAEIGAGARRYSADKTYQGVIARVNNTTTRARSLIVNPAVSADLRSQMSHFDKLTVATHNKIVALQALHQEIPPELIAEQASNSASYDAVVRAAQEQVRANRAAATGTQGATPGRPATPAAPARPHTTILHGNGFSVERN